MEVQINEQLIFAEHLVLETPRLILRPITLQDAPDMYAYAKDDETTRYVFPKHQSLEETRLTIARFFMSDPLGKYAVEYKENHQMIGTIDLRVNTDAGTGELGYTLNKAYWGKGIMPEAAEVLLELGFDKLKLVRIHAIHDLRNPKSGRVMEKIGMHQESVVCQSRKLRGEVVDIATYSISRNEWQQRKSATLE